MLQSVKDGYLITWPGLTKDAFSKHLNDTGHGYGPFEPAVPKHMINLESAR
jgi:hypothetical protein